MSFEQPIRHQRLKLSPEGIIARVDTLVESAEIVESSLQDFIGDVQLPDEVIAHVLYAKGLARRQVSSLNRAIKAAKELSEAA